MLKLGAFTGLQTAGARLSPHSFAVSVNGP
jgi:hypothetical protein